MSANESDIKKVIRTVFSPDYLNYSFAVLLIKAASLPIKDWIITPRQNQFLQLVLYAVRKRPSLFFFQV